MDKTMYGHSGSVGAIVRINANQVATGAHDHTVIVWDLNTGAKVCTLYGHTHDLYSLTILPSGILVSAGNEPSLLFWDIQANKMAAPRFAVDATVFGMLYNPKQGVNGTLVVLSGSIYFFDAISLAYLSKVAVGGADLDIHWPTGFIWVGTYTSVKYYNITSNSYSPEYTYGKGICKIKILPDNETLVIGTENGTVKLFSMSNLTYGVSYSGHTSVIFGLAITPDLQYLLTSSWDLTFAIWSWTSGSLTQINKWTLAAGGLIVPMNPILTGKFIFITRLILQMK
jgi:hypothetical protein